MNDNLLKIGEFAKLARTTKRTVIWYEEKGLLSPVKIEQSGYRYYKSEQIIDFQVILMLRKLNFSLEEIKTYLSKNNSLKSLFKLKRVLVEQEISRLQKSLKDIDTYYQNLDKVGYLVNPKIKRIKPFDIYYIDVTGTYPQIKEYGLKLKSYFNTIPQEATYLTVFMEPGFRPKKAKMKIGVITQKDMELKKEAKEIVKKMTIPKHKALTYLHIGSSTLLSLLWGEVEKYRVKNKIKFNNTLPFIDYELYRKTTFNNFSDLDNMIYEIILPVL